MEYEITTYDAVKSPCHHCAARHVGCHTTCEDYYSYKCDIEEWKRVHRGNPGDNPERNK